MNKEDKKLQKHLVDEMMKVSQTNPDVMYYMETLMKSYEKLEQELERYKNIIKETIEKSRCIFEDKTIDDDEAFYQLGCVIDKLENVIGGEINE